MIDRLKTGECWRKGRTAALEDTEFYTMPPSREDMKYAIGAIYNHLEDIIDRAWPVRHEDELNEPGEDVDTCMGLLNEFIDLCNRQEAGK